MSLKLKITNGLTFEVDTLSESINRMIENQPRGIREIYRDKFNKWINENTDKFIKMSLEYQYEQIKQYNEIQEEFNKQLRVILVKENKEENK